VSGLSERLVIRQGGYNLRFHASNLAEQLFSQPTLRAGALSFFRSYVKPGDVVVDVGANIGDTSIVCAQAVGATGMVYAFEPHPRVYSWLVENVRLNGLSNVATSNIALGAADDAAAFSNDRRDDMNRVIPSSVTAIQVPLKTLDGALRDLPHVDLLKIDVEGFELFVLRGALGILKRTSAIYIEVADRHFAEYGYGVSDVLATLAHAGFSLRRGVDTGDLQAIDDSYRPPTVENILAVRDIDDLESRLERQDPASHARR
jgi:FkbM family methyltransferase